MGEKPTENGHSVNKVAYWYSQKSKGQLVKGLKAEMASQGIRFISWPKDEW